MPRFSNVRGFIRTILATVIATGSLMAALSPELIFQDGFENHPPDIISTPVVDARVNVPYGYDVDATDIDGDILLFGLVVAPDGMSIDETSGEITWTPGTAGLFDVEVLVSDGNGGTAGQSWQIEVIEVVDTDGDGLSDDEEVLYGTDPNDPDSDDDGLLDGEEVFTYGTDPLDFDSDDDLFGDGTEISAGTDPLNAADFPVGIPDPEAVAPDPDPTVATTLFYSTEFLYTGDDAIQTGVAPGVIDPERAAVLRGKVLTKDGLPLPGATITILDHPEFGQTVSRANGLFDMVVNGGGYLVIDYYHNGYLPAQRTVNVLWQHYVWAPEVVLIPPDPAVTAVDMGSGETQVARGSVVSDSDGSRQATLMFPPGTTAELMMPDGSTQPVNSLQIRATEYSVGTNGPDTMPAELPPESAYTYCVELSADEAVAKVNGKDVIFNQPVPFYLDNFIGFPVGGNVPLGYYDSDRGAWIPTENGRVIEVLATAGELAELDVSGDGLADTGQALSDLGITDDERRQLAELYQAGDSLWRMQLNHLSTWDANWGVFPPDDAVYPNQNAPATNDETTEQGCEVTGSIIECQNQALGEQIPVVGTPFTLNYRSQSLPGRTMQASTVRVFLSAESVPASLLAIELQVDVAGQRFRRTFEPEPNQSTLFTWDGLDAYGRKPAGKQIAIVRIGYRYRGQYRSVARFGYNAGGSITGNFSRDELTLWQTSGVLVGTWEPNASALGGWGLDAHHSYSPTNQILYRGDGGRQGGQWRSNRKVVSLESSPDYWYMLSLAVAPDGAVYFSDSSWNRLHVYRIDTDGSVTHIAGGGEVSDGEGIPATGASLNGADDLEVGPDGLLYFCETYNHKIRKIDDEGLIWTVAGTGVAGFAGDGGPVEAAQLNGPTGLAFGRDSSLYIADRNNQRVRRVDPSGIISTVAGGGQSNADGIPATERNLGNVFDVATGPDGSLYVTSDSVKKVFQIDPSGIITPTGLTSSGAQVLQGLAVGMDGSVYVANQLTIKRRQANGAISNYVGTGSFGAACYVDGSLATGINTTPYDVAIGPEGDVYGVTTYTLGGGCRSVFRVTSVLPGFNGSDLAIPSEDGALLYRFSAEGRHLQTLSTLTGAVVYNFDYSPEGLLTMLTDGDGNVTTIEHDTDGTPTAIIGPYGQRTELTVDVNGYLATISNPAGETWQFEYTDGGLLTSAIDPNGNPSAYTYDAEGRLILAQDAAGGSQALARVEFDEAYEVSRTTGMGRTTTYRKERLPTGNQRWVNTFANGTSASVIARTDGSRTFSFQGGIAAQVLTSPDPRFGMQAPYIEDLMVTLPSGLTAQVAESQSAVFEDAPLNLVNLTTRLTVAGATTEAMYDASTRSLVSTTSEGRIVTITTDDHARPLQRSLAGLHPMSITYDARGRIESISVGDGPDAQSTTLTYAADGFPASVTNALGQSVEMERDAVGRLIRSILPDGMEVDFEYDARGNLLSLTPPGRPAHTFGYDSRSFLTTITPPEVGDSGATGFTYNVDGLMTDIDLPGNESIAFTYDPAGQLTGLTLSASNAPIAAYALGWNADGLVQSITGPGTQELDYTYDGGQITAVAWSGPVAGLVTTGFDEAFRLSSTQVNAEPPVAYTYDGDDLLTQVGELTIARDPDNGLPIATSLGTVSDSWDYDAFGYVSHYRAASENTTLYEANYERDALGNVLRKVETIGGITHTYDYSYDTRGQLIRVMRNDATIEVYAYDDNGNRASATIDGNALVATYDDQDRLLTLDAASFDYEPSGMMVRRTEEGAVTEYDYDPLGNLLGVSLPDGTIISYSVDGVDRRIGRKVNGVPAERFLYHRSQPVAEIDVNGEVASLFVYAQGNLPVYMVQGGNKYRILGDQSGSVRLVVDTASGEIVQRLDYDSFGRVVFDSNPGFQPFGFAGGLYDPDTGLVRFGARDYDATIGRWMAKDPIGFAGLDSNLYRYVFNNPINLIDPGGLNAVIDSIFGVTTGVWDALINPVGTIAQTVANGLADIVGYFVGLDMSPYHMETNHFALSLQSTMPGVDPLVDTTSAEFGLARACGDIAATGFGGGIAKLEALRSAQAARAELAREVLMRRAFIHTGAGRQVLFSESEAAVRQARNNQRIAREAQRARLREIEDVTSSGAATSRRGSSSRFWVD